MVWQNFTTGESGGIAKPTKNDFQIGDRVKHYKRDTMGVVTGINKTFRFDSGREYRNLVEVQWHDTAMRKPTRHGWRTLLLIERARPTAPTGSDMTMLKGREWKTSYTKKVVDEVVKMLPTWATWPGNPVHEAVELLKQYHRDLHLPYEQRDMYLKEVHRLGEIVKTQAGDLRAVQAHLAEANNIVRGKHKFNSPFGENVPRPTAVAHQTYVACPHYPNAIHNFFSEQTACEFCMKEGK